MLEPKWEGVNGMGEKGSRQEKSACSRPTCLSNQVEGSPGQVKGRCASLSKIKRVRERKHVNGVGKVQ